VVCDRRVCDLPFAAGVDPVRYVFDRTDAGGVGTTASP
jgi:hypothetical protein